MLAQHIITKPVFDALFEGYSFTQHNPVSIAMQSVLERLNEHSLDKETVALERFYENVRMQASGIKDLKSKQKIIIELYDKFFSSAFPQLKDKLGIVYTPVQVVDFIIHSVNDVLKSEFGQTLGSKGVHIIDPFTGTGTFVTRLLQSGLISKDELAYKFQNEIHANEIVLLAYYIAAINIEQVYHSIMGGDYVPFGGICLTDTFALYEPSSHLVGKDSLADNSTRRRKQKKLEIKVIVGNPPYSGGQASANDNNANVDYPVLNESIRKTYAAHSTATNKNGLYNSYIKAIRWASDRIGSSGVIGFVSNGGFVDDNTGDGLRKCLAQEFSSIYIFHLRGNAQTSGEVRRKEKDNIFAQGSRSPIAISVLVKNPKSDVNGQIFFHDIGDYLTRDEKLERIVAFGSIEGIKNASGWLPITPDKHNDWVNQRDNSFSEFVSLGDKKDDSAVAIFANYSSGVKTNRDAWVYNASRSELASNMESMANFYNMEVQRFKSACVGLTKDKYPEVDDFINTDSTKISWNRGLKNDLARHIAHAYQSEALVKCVYRPFTKSHMYFSKYYNDMTYQMARIFPSSDLENRVIWVTGVGASMDFTCFMSNLIPDLQGPGKIQCFPMWLYEESQAKDLFGGGDTEQGKYSVKDGITDAGLTHFKDAYKGEIISKEDLFYYVYGLLHSDDYKKRYADNLSKELPRIPAVKKFADFQSFSNAGRKLADLHINYETVAPYQVDIEGGALLLADFTDADYRVTQMKFASKTAKTRVVYNHKITMSGIPLEAYDYVVNGKPALEWVMERQAVTPHKESGILNDVNLWATETMSDASYPLKLFQRVITVSIETMKIVRALPRLDIQTEKA